MNLPPHAIPGAMAAIREDGPPRGLGALARVSRRGDGVSCLRGSRDVVVLPEPGRRRAVP